MFRNYDGKGAVFGDTSVSATTSASDKARCTRASRAPTATNVVVVAINKQGRRLQAGITLKHTAHLGGADVRPDERRVEAGEGQRPDQGGDERLQLHDACEQRHHAGVPPISKRRATKPCATSARPSAAGDRRTGSRGRALERTGTRGRGLDAREPENAPDRLPHVRTGGAERRTISPRRAPGCRHPTPPARPEPTSR